MDITLNEWGNNFEWSLDGKAMAFSAADSEVGQPDVYVVNADSGQLINVTNHSARDEFTAWASDGQHILFVSDRDVQYKNSLGRPDYWKWVLYIMDADGKSIQRVVDGIERHPRHDLGVRVPFSDSQIVVEIDDRMHVINIECILTNSTQPGELPKNCDVQLPEMTWDFSPPNWPPGGRLFSYAACIPHPIVSEACFHDIYVVNFDGTELRNLTDCPADDIDPDWSP